MTGPADHVSSSSGSTVKLRTGAPCVVVPLYMASVTSSSRSSVLPLKEGAGSLVMASSGGLAIVIVDAPAWATGQLASVSNASAIAPSHPTRGIILRKAILFRSMPESPRRALTNKFASSPKPQRKYASRTKPAKATPLTESRLRGANRRLDGLGSLGSGDPVRRAARYRVRRARPQDEGRAQAAPNHLPAAGQAEKSTRKRLRPPLARRIEPPAHSRMSEPPSAHVARHSRRASPPRPPAPRRQPPPRRPWPRARRGNPICPVHQPTQSAQESSVRRCRSGPATRARPHAGAYARAPRA